MTAPIMRAKMQIQSIEKFASHTEKITFAAIGKPQYGVDGVDGVDEDNTYSRFTPQAQVTLFIANPELYGKLTPGERYYVDFTFAENQP